MLKGTDDAAFGALMQDLCLAFNRPYTTELSRVFWEALKHYPIFDIRRSCDAARSNLKKFPTPRELAPERRPAPPPPVDDGPPMSRWAIAANKILFAVAYGDLRRGFQPIGVWERMPEKGWGLPLRLARPVDISLLNRALEIKRDFVSMGEQSEAEGEPMLPNEFDNLCRDGFRKLLGTRAAA